MDLSGNDQNVGEVTVIGSVDMTNDAGVQTCLSACAAVSGVTGCQLVLTTTGSCNSFTSDIGSGNGNTAVACYRVRNNDLANGISSDVDSKI